MGRYSATVTKEVSGGRMSEIKKRPGLIRVSFLFLKCLT